MRLLKWILPLIAATTLSSCGYNTMVSQRETVKEKWSQVETQYQRRSDLIPNLVNTVKGAADFEKETLTGVIEARSKATQVTVDPNKLTAENIQNFQKAQGQVSSALSRLLVTVERYPDLKANQNFRDLQAQLEGTENRISVARKNYNESVKVYNTSVQQFPRNLVAGMFSFEQMPYYEADEGSEKAPEVSF
jgi:LemA protein